MTNFLRIIFLLGLTRSVVSSSSSSQQQEQEQQDHRREQVVVENDEVIPEELYTFVYGYPSVIDYDIENTTKYYCIFRNLWTRERHPNGYPQLARMSGPFMMSHTEYYYPFLKNIQASYGVTSLAMYGTNEQLEEEVSQAGNNVLSYGSYDEVLKINYATFDEYKYIPPMEVKVDIDEDIYYHFLSAVASISPSPDWYTSFYLFDVADIQTKKLWQHFKIHTYPWDAGVDAGTEYTSTARPEDPKRLMQRMTVESAPNGVFVDETGSQILPVGEWECILDVCPLEDPDCVKEDWPPSNGCDVLKYPACNQVCDPEIDFPCERCRYIPGVDPEVVYFTDCCLSGRHAIDRECEGLIGSAPNAKNHRFLLVFGSALALYLTYLF